MENGEWRRGRGKVEKSKSRNRGTDSPTGGSTAGRANGEGGGEWGKVEKSKGEGER